MQENLKSRNVKSGFHCNIQWKKALTTKSTILFPKYLKMLEIPAPLNYMKVINCRKKQGI
jgi:hypothetical protein